MSYQTDQFIFLATARTGSHTISALLTEHLGATLVGTHHTEDFEEGDEREVISFVRDPYDLIVSHYCAQKNPDVFTRWLPDYLSTEGRGRDGRIWFPNNKLYPYYKQSSTIYRFELMKESWEDIWRQYGSGDCPPLQVRPPRRDYRTFYSDKTKEWLANWLIENNATYGLYE